LASADPGTCALLVGRRFAPGDIARVRGCTGQKRSVRVLASRACGARFDVGLPALQGTRRDSLVPRASPPGRNPSCEFAPARPSQGASPCDGFHEVLSAPRSIPDLCRGRDPCTPVTVAAVAHARHACTLRNAETAKAPAALRSPFQSSHPLGAVPVSRPRPSCGSRRAALQPLTRAPAPGLRSPRRAPRGVKSPVANSRRVHPSRACPPPSWRPVCSRAILLRASRREVRRPSLPSVLESCEAAESPWPSAIASPSGFRGLALAS
jgi:hypothetical protein